MQRKSNVKAFTTKLQALQIRADKVKEKDSAQKYRHHIDAVHYQNRKNCNIKVFEKYLNCNEKMTIRNERVEREECKETKKNESMIVRV